MEEFVVRKSVWGVVTFWSVLACILIIPIFILIIRILLIKQEKITFYSDKIVVEKGLLNKSTKKFAFTGVFNVDLYQPLMGRICNYGNLTVDFVGKTDLDTRFVKNPQAVVSYLETKIVKKSQVSTHMF